MGGGRGVRSHLHLQCTRSLELHDHTVEGTLLSCLFVPFAMSHGLSNSTCMIPLFYSTRGVVLCLTFRARSSGTCHEKACQATCHAQLGDACQWSTQHGTRISDSRNGMVQAPPYHKGGTPLLAGSPSGNHVDLPSGLRAKSTAEPRR